MANSLNKIMLIGNLGQDVESRFTTNNTEINSFSIATTHSYKGKDSNWVNETTWHNITSFGLSDYLKGRLKKGSSVFVEGRLSKDEYTDKDGIKRQSVKVISEKIILLDRANTGQVTVQAENNSEDESDLNELPF